MSEVYKQQVHDARGAHRVWTLEEIEAEGVRTSLEKACSMVYGCGRTKAYQMHAAGELDFPVLRARNRIVVPTAPLKALLGLTPPLPEASAAPHPRKEIGSHHDANAAG